MKALPIFGNFLKKNLVGKNTSISLGQHYEEFIAQKLASGAFKNASEVVRAGLRLLEEREQKVEILRKALDEGLRSGVVTDFDPEEFLDELSQSRAG